MNQANPPVQFSVVMATRDRPQLFSEALASVMRQKGVEFEIIVVNDGTRADFLPAYQGLWDRAKAQFGERFRIEHLPFRTRGHGQSYSLNVGVSLACADYVCFLDDDDYWTDTEHLLRASQAIAQAGDSGETLDMYMANQDAWIEEPPQHLGTLWLGKMAKQLIAAGRTPDENGIFKVSIDDLFKVDGFCHLNCLTVRRKLYQDVGGMDEGIRWECDRDLYLRLVEVATCMRHHAGVMAHHRVPDPKKKASMTTSLQMVEKRLLQSIVLDRALLRTKQAVIFQHAAAHKSFALQKLANEFALEREWSKAAVYARQAAAIRPSLGALRLWVYCQFVGPLSKKKP